MTMPAIRPDFETCVACDGTMEEAEIRDLDGRPWCSGCARTVLAEQVITPTKARREEQR